MQGREASVPAMVSWSGRVAQRTAMAGVSGERPWAINWRAISGNVVSPMKITRVSAWPTLAQSMASHGVAGDEGDGGGVLAMGERDAGVGGDAEGRGDAGHDLERDAGIGQGFGFFAAAAEDEGVAAFEADYGESAARAVDEHAADFVLREFVGGFFLADVDALGVGRGEIEEGGVGEVIVEDGVGLLEDAAAFDGEELRVSGAGADEVDLHGHGAPAVE